MFFNIAIFRLYKSQGFLGLCYFKQMVDCFFLLHA